MEENLPATLPDTDLASASRVSVSAEVIANLASLAALEVPGVLDLAGGNRLAEMLGLKRLTRGVHIKVGGETLQEEVVELALLQNNTKSLDLDVGLTVDAAAILPEVAMKVQAHVIDKLWKSLQVKPAQVNVLVAHVRMHEGVEG